MNLSRLRSSDLPFPLRWAVGLFSAAASLQLAVVLIAIYAAVLAWATWVESKHGGAAAHFGIYDSGWFAAMGALLAINVLCAALIRFPWKRRQTGFVVTHLGILVLLAGCLVSRQYGIEAQLPIFEGRAAHQAFEDSYHFELRIDARGEGKSEKSVLKPPRDALTLALSHGERGLDAEEPICVPFVAGPFNWKEYDNLSWFPWQLAYRSRGTIYDQDGVTLEVLDYTKDPQPSARVRLTVDGTTEELDVAASSDEPGGGSREQVVAAKQRRVAITLRPDEVDLGFQLYLHRFQRKLDPGTGAASHYSSLVDFLDRGAPPQKLQEDILITLNAPVDFADPQTGRTYRLFQSSFSGPWTPGEPEFDQLIGTDHSRDQLYLSRLSVNDDPGRGLKYVGSLLIIVGIVIVYYLRAYFVRKKDELSAANVSPLPTNLRSAPGEGQGVRVWRCVLFFIILFLSANGACLAEDGGRLDWTTWQHLPVFGEGRVVPLDTFARETVEAICGCTNPTLALPDDQPREFTPAELLLSWLVEPEKWENVPFLVAQDEELRRDVLGLPLFDEAGRRLRYASPVEVETNGELGQRWADLQKRADAHGSGFRLNGVDKKIKALVDAYGKFRVLTYDLNAPKDSPRRFYARVRSAANAWRKVAANPQAAKRISRDEDVRRLMLEAGESLQKLIAQVHGDEFLPKKVEEPVAVFRRAGEQLAACLADSDDKPLVALAADLRRETAEMHLAMYDNGETLRFVPALNSGALEENRMPSDDAAPWLSFQAMMFGSDELLQSYPQADLIAVRKAWADVKTAYLDRASAEHLATFSAAMNRFAAAVRELGEQIEPFRQNLPILHRDQTLIDATAYPPPGSTNAEVFYNRLDPFFWSWVVSLVATLCLLFAVGRVQRPMFWLGAIVLAVAQLCTIAGFGLRAYLTGLVPLTGMFETVVFVALCVAVLGLWFALLPLFWSGLRAAWRLTGLPDRNAKGHGAAQWILLLVQMGLMVLVFANLARYHEWLDRGLFDLTPPIALGASMPSANEVFVWLTGLFVLLTTVYCVPRVAVTFAVGLFTIPHTLARHGAAVGMKSVLQRRLFALAGAMVSFAAVALAYYAPPTVMHRNIGSAAPILRDNFWLVVHVVTIIASYGSAAIALILGNISLGYYLFGRYEGDSPIFATNTPVQEATPIAPRKLGQSPVKNRRPPEACSVLAGFIYTAIQITVLLLAAGTILGALWADKAWGRFWAWDPKEVWALISLLVYVVILHARYAGWSRDFGMALAAVLGATAVLFTWYGVNFLLGSGMHSYGSGAGGQWQVGTAVAIQWLFLLVAAGRYLVERGE